MPITTPLQPGMLPLQGKQYVGPRLQRALRTTNANYQESVCRSWSSIVLYTVVHKSKPQSFCHNYIK